MVDASVKAIKSEDLSIMDIAEESLVASTRVKTARENVMNTKQSMMKGPDIIKAVIAWPVIGTIMLLVTAFPPGRATAQAAPPATIYSSAAADLDMPDEVYAALDGNQAHLYMRGSCTNLLFDLGTYPAHNRQGSLEIDLSADRRHEARQRLARSFDDIAARVRGSSPHRGLPGINDIDSPLKRILLFFQVDDTSDTTAVELALQAFNNDMDLMNVRAAIADLKQGYFAQCTAGITESAVKQAASGLRVEFHKLFEDDAVRNVFYEKEALESLSKDIASVDREIATCYSNAAEIARAGTGAANEAVISELEALELLSTKAVLMGEFYHSFCAAIGFENLDAAQDNAAIATWNETLWECVLCTFSGGERQYDLRSVQQLLERLVRDGSMAGDAARALCAIQALDRLAAGSDRGTMTVGSGGH